jgi:hypothetical protein
MHSLGLVVVMVVVVVSDHLRSCEQECGVQSVGPSTGQLTYPEHKVDQQKMPAQQLATLRSICTPRLQKTCAVESR